jgi:addiction module RelE/StbE family toxin
VIERRIRTTRRRFTAVFLGFTGAFKKDRKRAGRRGKTLEKLDDLIRRLARGEKLEARFRDHKLSGESGDSEWFHKNAGDLRRALDRVTVHRAFDAVVFIKAAHSAKPLD